MEKIGGKGPRGRFISGDKVDARSGRKEKSPNETKTVGRTRDLRNPPRRNGVGLNETGGGHSK